MIYVSARVDYALRSMLTLAAAAPQPMHGVALAQQQGLPAKYLHAVLADLRRAGLIQNQRGRLGAGYLLGRPAGEITVEDVVCAMEKTLLEVYGSPPAAPSHPSAPGGVHRVWVAAEGAVRQVFQEATLADLLRDYGWLHAPMTDPGR